MTRPGRLAGQRVWVMAKGYAPDEGGMQTYARGVAEAYAALGAEVTVFSQTSLGPRDERVGAVRLIDIGAGKSISVPFRLRGLLMRERDAKGGPALLHATTWRTSIPPLLARLPFITTFHGREFMYGGRATAAVLRLIARRARHCVVVSGYSAARLMERIPTLPAPPIVAWNGTAICPDPPEADAGVTFDSVPLILSLCRLEPRKNILNAVEAAALCRDRGLHFRFVISGRGPDLEAVRTLVAKRDLGSHVEVAGRVEDARAKALYHAADIFLHPQSTIDKGRDFEGFGIAIADAMLVRCAVIAGQDGGPAELIENGKDGLLVDGNDPDAIAAAMETLLRDAEQRTALGDSARDKAMGCTWLRHVETILDAIEQREGKTP